MKYGKIRIEDGYLIFTKHMMMNNLLQGYTLGIYETGGNGRRGGTSAHF